MASGAAVNNAGNSAAATVSGINIDKTPPTIAWVGAINNGDSFYFGFVPSASNCIAADALSGPDRCNVSGYGTSVGSLTLIAAAYDVAGNI